MESNLAIRTEHPSTGEPGRFAVGTLLCWSSLAVARARSASSWAWGDPSLDGLLVERAWLGHPDAAGRPSYRVLWGPASVSTPRGERDFVAESWCSEFDLTPIDDVPEPAQLHLFGATPLRDRLHQGGWPTPDAYPRSWSAVDAATWIGDDLDEGLLVGSEPWRRSVLFAGVGAGAPRHEPSWAMRPDADLERCVWAHPHLPVDLVLERTPHGWRLLLQREGLRPFEYGTTPDLVSACNFASTLLWEGLL